MNRPVIVLKNCPEFSCALALVHTRRGICIRRQPNLPSRACFGSWQDAVPAFAVAQGFCRTLALVHGKTRPCLSPLPKVPAAPLLWCTQVPRRLSGHSPIFCVRRLSGHSPIFCVIYSPGTPFFEILCFSRAG